VRSYCELHGIPVQSAAEERGSFWRFRETQALVDALRGSERKLLDAGVLRDWLKTRPTGQHWDALRGAVEEYALETGEQELPVGHFFEWLAEWCRDVRIRQTGLLLLSAHRAKGLEFDHVAVLDGNWNGSSGREDPDAPRRLYYVAMTRARQSLMLARMAGRSRLLDELPSHPSLINRISGAPEEIPVEMYRRHMRLSLANVDLSFAGRYGNGHAVHRALQRLSVGDALELCEREGKWELVDANTRPVCRLAKAFSPPQGMRCVDAKVAAVAVRFEEDSEPEYREHLRCAKWEVILPELVFEPLIPEGTARADAGLRELA
jgi:ATP-dependent DNA helicase RecQ